MLWKARECLMEATDLLNIMRDLRSCNNICASRECRELPLPGNEQHSFAELGKIWQAPLYEISIKAREGLERVLPVFNNFVVNETSDDLEAEFLNKKYSLARESCFYMNVIGASILL